VTKVNTLLGFYYTARGHSAIATAAVLEKRATLKGLLKVCDMLLISQLSVYTTKVDQPSYLYSATELVIALVLHGCVVLEQCAILKGSLKV
jgi:hypothetical protein